MAGPWDFEVLRAHQEGSGLPLRCPSGEAWHLWGGWGGWGWALPGRQEWGAGSALGTRRPWAALPG